MTDPGDGRDTPGLGRLFVLDPNLEPRPSIDLTSGAVGTVPPVWQRARVSLDGAFVYVTSGAPSGGPLFGFQPSRVLIVEVARAMLVGEVPLDDWGSG